LTHNQFKYTRLFVYMIFFLLISMSYNVIGHGTSEVESDYDGPTFLIPLIDNSPTIDGIAADIEFPEQGHLELPGLLDEVKISHNNTALFVSITVDAEEFVGIALQSRGGHGGSLTEFAYFLTGVNDNNQTDQMIRVADANYTDPSNVENSETIYVTNVEENDDTRVYELMISINDDSDDEISDIHDPIEDLKPRLGALFNLIILNGEGDDITSTDVSKSSIIPAYLLRQGEDPSEIAELLENNPFWIDVLIFPLILFSLSVYFVWKYKLIPIKNGGN